MNRRCPCAASASWLAACGGGGREDTSYGNEIKITVNTPQMIAQASADNYDNNVNGLITAATLKRWIANWTTNRPAGITGKLVIFQATVGPAGAEYIKPNGTTVFTYLSPSSEWVQTRINGVIETQSMVPDGPTMDALFKKYNVDPQNDMIVCAQGTGATGNAMSQGRCWYALRYWGVDKTNVSVLNGGNQWINGNGMVAADFTATASIGPGTGSASVRSLLVDNTALQATFEDLLAVLTETDANKKDDGVFIWDARSVGQFSAGERLEAVSDAGFVACGSSICPAPAGYDYMRTFQNAGSRQGHPRGTLQLQYTNLLDFDQGLLLQAQGCARQLPGRRGGRRRLPVHRRHLWRRGPGQCLPVRRRDLRLLRNHLPRHDHRLRLRRHPRAAGALLRRRHGRVEFAVEHPGQHRQVHPAGGLAVAHGHEVVLPSLQQHGAGRPRNIVNAYAMHANKIILEDQAYKRGQPGGGTAGQSGGPGGNPCG